MAKLLMSFLLSLCVLLVSGYGQLCAHKYQGSKADSCESMEALVKCNKGAPQLEEQGETHLLKRYAGAGTRDFRIDATEIEEEEDKQSHANVYPTAVLCAHILGYSIDFNNSPGIEASYHQAVAIDSLPDRYLLLQVIRI